MKQAAIHYLATQSLNGVGQLHSFIFRFSFTIHMSRTKKFTERATAYDVSMHVNRVV